MNDKALAIILAMIVVAPICVMCILGPALLGSALALGFAWFGGLDAVSSMGLAILAGLMVFGFLQRKRARSATAKPEHKVIP